MVILKSAVVQAIAGVSKPIMPQRLNITAEELKLKTADMLNEITIEVISCIENAKIRNRRYWQIGSRRFISKALKRHLIALKYSLAITPDNVLPSEAAYNDRGKIALSFVEKCRSQIDDMLKNSMVLP